VPEDGILIVLSAIDKIWTPVSEGVNKTILTYTLFNHLEFKGFKLQNFYNQPL